MKNILYIDTADNQKTKVILEINGKKIHKEESLHHASQNLLPLIAQILKENNLALRNLSEIKVNTGSGSFTGLRVGISVANTLGSQLKIPINGKPPGQLVLPTY
ncbi:tRNA (adenosine(37)-N6)-threonylcarbamoyltransferase complex dimerization subunit type 1 TsaB [Candidatus Gottesmanbacteria bacterium]|nr:tRNA (adenosine(37)-N6)-threonylcarbamoyltransferase complex dimerization subunit type 1 TsaB [Candidatus Gottesmanbacteria bacterium]